VSVNSSSRKKNIINSVEGAPFQLGRWLMLRTITGERTGCKEVLLKKMVLSLSK